MAEIIELPYVERNYTPVHEGIEQAYTGYVALVGEPELKAGDSAEDIRAALQSELTITDTLLNKQRKALKDGDVKTALQTLQQINEKRVLAESVKENRIIEQMYQEAWEVDNKAAVQAMLTNHAAAREAFNVLGARFKQLWEQYFWNATFSAHELEHDTELSEHLPEFLATASALREGVAYINFLEKNNVVQCPAGAYLWQANHALENGVVERLHFPHVDGEKYYARLKVASELAATLSAISKPGTEIEIKWRSNSELKAEAAAFQKMKAALGDAARVQAPALRYWQTNA